MFFDNMGNLSVNIACGSSSTNDTIFSQWFIRRRFLNVFVISLYKIMSPEGGVAIYDPRDLI